MRIKRLAILAGAVLAICGAAAVSGAIASGAVGEKAPAFELPGIDGRSVARFPSETAQPTLVVFWASWCPHCRTEMPILQKLYDELKPRGVSFIGVSCDRDAMTAARYARDKGITFPIAFAGGEKGQGVVTAYSVRGLPTTFLIDAGGVIRHVRTGEASAEEIRKDLAALGLS